MVMSVNTNVGAMVALQNLNATNKALDRTQSRINTGLRVASAADDAASYQIAQAMKGDKAAYESVQTGLDLAKATVNTALKAGESMADILIEVKAKCVQANQSSLDNNSRSALNAEFSKLLVQIDTIARSASFNGKNLIELGATSLTVLATVQGSTMSISAQEIMAINLQYGVPNCDLLNSANAVIALSVTNTAITTISKALASLGSSYKAVEIQSEFTSKYIDILTEGIGTMIDADMAKEAASLQALQVKQQLGTQALGIANSRPQTMLGLYG